jgi:hypothetical protein
MLIGALLLAGCAGLQAAKQTTAIPYYETVYWGEEKSCELENGKIIGRLSKTYQAHPEKDMPWVTDENSDDDDVRVTLVWDMPQSTILATCFYLDETKKESCGVLDFDSMEGKQLFIDKSDRSSMIGAYSIPALKEELKRQIRVTEKYTVGEDADYCEFIEDIMGA